MKTIIKISTIFALMIILNIQSGFSQDKNRKNMAWPDSLSKITIQGVVLFDSTHQNVYFLDEDGDNLADYHLLFGPDWYLPESGAIRPEEGETITIIGSVSSNPEIPNVIVFEIDGLVWRDPIENWWKHEEWCDSLDVITVTGTVLIDTTYFYHHYFLDTDNNSEPDYLLNFGPPWFSPDSGVVKPLEGDVVTIEGIEKTGLNTTIIVVLKIDDQVWRDKNGPSPWSGKWVGKNSQQKHKIQCFTDTSSWVEFPPGAFRGNDPHSGNPFADSIFCEFAQVWRDSLPGYPDSVAAGWYFHFSNPAGNRINGKGKAVKFLKQLRMHLNCGDCDSLGNFLPKRTATSYKLKYWDENTEQWVEVQDAIFDDANTLFFSEPESLNSYYAVFYSTESATLVEDTKEITPNNFILKQNYPNPFNPTTMIEFETTEASHVKLQIFNIMGQEVKTLVHELKPAGSYKILWNGHDNAGNLLSSGQYFYKIQLDNQAQINTMIFMK